MTEGFKGILVAVTVLLVAGCGGGGSNGATAMPGAFQAQGIAQGTTGQGSSVLDIILETGEFYSFSTAAGITLTVDHGNLLESGAGISANLVEFNVGGNTALSGVMTGLFIAQSAITGTTQIGLYQFTAFSANYLPIYNTPATLSTLAGTYSGVYTYGGTPVTMSVSATGAITGTSTNCAISGTATPRASGKNVFNLSLTLTGANCIPTGVGTATGVMVLNSESGLTRLYAGALNPAGTNGFFWIGTKQ
ncbi:MAG: hypothetical protein G3I10_10740 [Ferrovum sp.]|nr:hypothetical protein [Ferrovum sp.]